jgi:hypothetical protein
MLSPYPAREIGAPAKIGNALSQTIWFLDEHCQRPDYCHSAPRKLTDRET